MERKSGMGNKDFIGESINRAAEAGAVAFKVAQILNEYEENCSKPISKWEEFTEDDVKKELKYCTDVFMLMKTGDRIKCDCGSREIALTFEGNMGVYKGGMPSLAESDIPPAIKAHSKDCFGTCLLEEPSKHPGKNKTGGNPCEPYIVGTSWLETYNNAKAGDMKTVLYDKSWLACKYLGRIMSADTVPEIDTTGMTEDDAFEWMLRWAKGEYIPQVLLDKITHIYAGGDEAVEAFRKEFPYSDAKKDPIKAEKYKDLKFELYDNIDAYDSKFLAWSKFANNLWEGEQKDAHLEIRPVVLKAISMVESGMGTDDGYNGTINIMQSLTIGDGTLWHLADYNPEPKVFYTTVNAEKKDSKANADDTSGTATKKNVLVWRSVPHEGKDMVDNGYVQFPADDYFYELSGDVTDSRFEKVALREHFFGRADIGDTGNPILREAIKTVATHFPEAPKSNDGTVLPEDGILMVVYDQQSVDMSLYAACLVLANKCNTEREAVGLYNTSEKEKKDTYTLAAEYKLDCLGAVFAD